jgi:guanosine-3',5'-bis(diphosphate) 3'-pyrophosphohydrolase
LRASVYSTTDGRGIQSFEIDVQDVQHLTRVMESVQKIKGVQQVERVRVGRNK